MKDRTPKADPQVRTNKEVKPLRRPFRTMASLLLAVAMFFSLIPALPASAANGALFFHFSNLSTDPNSPTPENRSSIKVSGTYNGVNPNTISYEIKRFDDTTTGGTGVKPILDEAANTFEFLNVQLNQGVNKIIVSGMSTQGQQVSATAYVKFSDVPAVYEVALSDGRVLEENSSRPVVVTTETISISVKATNGSKGVTVNGQSMYPGGGDMFYSAGIQLKKGVNDLVIVVNSESRTQTIHRQVVYHPTGSLTANDLRIGGTSIDGQAVVTGNVNGTITGYVVVDAPAAGATPVPPVLEVGVFPVGSTVPIANLTATVGQASILNNTLMYPFTTNGTVSITQSGEYLVYIKDTATGYDVQKTFTYRDANAPTIKQVHQLYGVTESGSTVSFSSQSIFPSSNDTVLNELPLYLMVEQVNAGTATIESSKGANIASTFTYNGNTVFKITNLPSGQQNLIIKVSNGSGVSDTKVIPVTFLSSSYIDVYNLYNNQLFKNSTDFTQVSGRIVNYTGTQGLTLALNGNTIDLPVSSNGEFNYVESPQAANRFLQLVPGPNTLVVADKSGKISTRLTLLYFSDNRSVIKNMIPFPVGSPTESDPDKLFTETDKNAFTTYEKEMGLRFEVDNTDEVTVTLSHPSSTIFAVFTQDNTGTWRLTGGALKTQLDAINQVDHNLYYTITTGTSSSNVRVVLKELALPEVGLQAISIGSRIQSVTTTDTIEITRERAPYQVLSPKLPNEGVLKQNFVEVSIKAEGADSVTIGKEPMVKSEISDIFRLEVKNLKNGKNTIKFTIEQGSKKTNGQIVVQYVDDATEGSQYKASISKSGKINVFKGGLSLQLPKGTVLQQANSNPKAEVPTINLLGEHDILFGIANQIDGRTIKAYNRIGEIENGVEMDGRLSFIPGDSGNAFRFTPAPHFGYASPLYWLDAGSLNAYSSNVEDFNVKQATHPYAKGHEFHQRLIPQNWMELSQKGTITLKYDSALVNAASGNLGIWWYNPSQGTWTNIGGKVDSKKKTVTATFKGFGYYAVKSLRYSYSDAISHKTARNDIELMLARGYMKAAKQDAFGVYDPMTRGEFATIVVKLLDIPLDYDVPINNSSNKLTFDDIYQETIPANALWDYRYIETAARKGIIRGIAPRSFAPNMELSREEAANIIARALNLKMGEIEKDKATLQKQFEDVGKIKSNYSYPAILAVSKAGILTGVANSLKEGEKKPTYNFNPDAVMNRADTATVVKRMMSKLKLL